MSRTPIGWTDETWNPVRGCSRVSEGCRHCYAEQQAARIVRMGRGSFLPPPFAQYRPPCHKDTCCMSPFFTSVMSLCR